MRSPYRTYLWSMSWGKSPKTVLRSAFDALLDVEAVWGIASSLGLSSLVIAWGRSASTWYLKLDPAGQAVAGIGAFLILYAASFTAWRFLGRKVLYWVRRRFFPVDVSASLGPRSLYLAVRNRTSTQRFRGDVNWIPVTSDDHLPVALTWKQSNEETREIIRNGRADLLMCDFYFVPPHTRDRQYRPLFHFSIPTPTGDTI